MQGPIPIVRPLYTKFAAMAIEENKYAVPLLLQPARLLHRPQLLQLLSLSDKDNTADRYELELTASNIKLFTDRSPGYVYQALNAVSTREQLSHRRLLDELVEWQKLEGEAATQEKDASMARYLRNTLYNIARCGSWIKWYHRLAEPGGKRMRTARCRVKSLSVSLAFEIEVRDGSYSLNTIIVDAGERIPLSAFTRYHFLLLHEDTYRFLTLNDYHTLERLEKMDLATLGRDQDAFFLEVVQPLRKASYKVSGDNEVALDTLEVEPVNRVKLSELSNTFLMFTPQYVYDGYVLDGTYTPTTEVLVQGKPLRIIRHKEAEEAFNLRLCSLHPDFARQRNGYYYIKFADAQKKQWFLKVYHDMLATGVQVVGMDMLRHFKMSPHLATTTVEVMATEGDTVRLRMEVKFGKEKVPLRELQQMLQNGQKAVLLKDGSLGALGEDWLQQYATGLKHGKVQKNELTLPRWMALSEAEDSDTYTLRRSMDMDWWQQWKQWQKDEGAMYSLPAAIQVEALRSYQQRGYDWLRVLSEAGGSMCLADDMGLGKTLQTICFLAARIEQHPEARHLVVGPASLVYNWLAEANKFAPSLRTAAYHGSQRSIEMLHDKSIQIVVTSYGTMRQDIEEIETIAFDTIVLDESHNIKNLGAQNTRAALRLQASTRIALSGTPLMNGTGDLYAQMEFLLPGLLGGREFFQREYAVPIEQNGDAEKAAALQKIIAPFVLRRTKEQVATDLPEKMETILWCEMGRDQMDAYNSVKEQVRSNVLLEIEANGLNKGKMSVLAGLMRLRQLCNSAALVPDMDLFCYDSIKTEILLQELRNIIPQHKALVFSQFTSMLDLLEKDLSKAGISYLRLDGSTQIKERQQLVEQFQQAGQDAPSVFLLSLKAGNAGLTLTEADYVFLFDPWWNAAVENQAIDRTHRIGQQKQVFAYRMICRNTIEERILNIQSRKKKLAEELVGTDESFMKNLSLEDIQYLLE